MDFQDQIRATGSLTIIKTDINGNITDKRYIPNLVVTVGKEFIVSRMIGTSAAVMSHMGVGTGVTSPLISNTAVESPLGARVALSSTTQSSNTVTYVAAYGAGVSTGALTEAGIFNAVTAGSMLCRTIFPVVNKAIGDSIAITWVVTIS